MTLPAENDWGITSFSKMLGSFMAGSIATAREPRGLSESLCLRRESIRRAVAPNLRATGRPTNTRNVKEKRISVAVRRLAICSNLRLSHVGIGLGPSLCAFLPTTYYVDANGLATENAADF
jgi:hypothetical protein